EHASATGPERCHGTRRTAEAQGSAGTGKSSGRIEQGSVSSTVGAGFRRQPAAASPRCILESKGRLEKGDWRRVMRLFIGITTIAALSILAGCGTKVQK